MPTLYKASGGGGGGPLQDLVQTARAANTTIYYSPLAGGPDPITGWQDLRVGAGGWLVGMDMHSDGSMAVRADSYGAYIWDDTINNISPIADGGWRQVVTGTSIPAGAPKYPNVGFGCYDIRFAPSNSNILYMNWLGYVWKSTNKGASWALCTGWARIGHNETQPANPNDRWRTAAQKMAVNPTDPNHVIHGCPGTACRQTLDGGTNWSNLPTVPVSDAAHYGYVICFIDTNTVIVNCANNGCYISTNKGSTFTAMTGGDPTNVSCMVKAADGIVYACINNDGVLNFTDNAAWKYASGTWTNLAANFGSGYHGGGAGWVAITCNPANAAHVVVVSIGGYINQSFDRGVTWLGLYNLSTPATVTNAPNTDDIPWLSVTNDVSFKATGAAHFHPTTGELYISEGIGVWHCTLPTTFNSSSHIVWHSQSRGIEQLITNNGISPPGGAPVLFFYDRAFFKIEDPFHFPAYHGPNYVNALTHAWGGDYASSDPTFIVGLTTSNSGIQGWKSLNGGATWALLPSFPAPANLGYGGHIVASTPSNLVWVPGNGGPLSYTTDGGVTWNLCAFNVAPTNAWIYAYYLKTTVVCADRVTPGVFYAYNHDGGMYRSTDGGANFTQTTTGSITAFTGANQNIRSVPGHAGHVVYTAGATGGYESPNHPSQSQLMRTTDGVTWAGVPGIFEPHNVGFGAPIGAGYDPTVYVLGYKGPNPYNFVYTDYTWGIWQSTNFNLATPTWTSLGVYPNDSLDTAFCILGDMSHPGRVYVGIGGSAWKMYVP